MRTEDFDYELPADSIAQAAVEPRDSARLLDCRDLSDHVFSELPDLLQPGDLLVVNRTRVRKARLLGTRADSGGVVELLLVAGSADRWTALARPSKRLRPGLIIDVGRLTATVLTAPEAGIVTIALVAAEGTVADAIEAEGEVPLPPYFTGTLDDPERYQTVYAKEPTSAAAPTAGLHFTPAVLERLAHREVDVAELELAVGLDTFRPIAAESVDDHVIHTEEVIVDAETVAAVTAARQRNGRIIAVGTTAVRALEAAADGAGGVTEFRGPTDLFIRPGYSFAVIDGLITNFHVPRSTLIVLVAALMGPAWRDAYEAASARGYRMLSFGDAMMAFR